MNKFVKVAIIATSMLALGTLSAQAHHNHSTNSAFVAVGSSANADADKKNSDSGANTGGVAVTKGNAAADGQSGSFAIAGTSHRGSFAAAGGGSSVSACSGYAC